MPKERKQRLASVDRRIADRRELELALESFLDRPFSSVHDIDDFVDRVGAKGALVVPALVGALGSPDPRKRAVTRAILSAVLDVEALVVLLREARRPGLDASAHRDLLVLAHAVDPEGRVAMLTDEERGLAALGSIRAVLDGVLLDPSATEEVIALYETVPSDTRDFFVDEAGAADEGADPEHTDLRKLLAAKALLQVEDDPRLRSRLIDLVATATPPEALFALASIERCARSPEEARGARLHAMRLRTAGHVATERTRQALRSACDAEGRSVHVLAAPDVAGTWDVVIVRLGEDGTLDEIDRGEASADAVMAIEDSGLLAAHVPIAPAPWSEVAEAVLQAVESAPAVDRAIREWVVCEAEADGEECAAWTVPAPGASPSFEWLRSEPAVGGWRIEPTAEVLDGLEERIRRIALGNDGEKVLLKVAKLLQPRVALVPRKALDQTGRRTMTLAAAFAARGEVARAQRIAAAAASLSEAERGGAWAELLLARGTMAAMGFLHGEETRGDDRIRRALRIATGDAAGRPPTKADLLALEVACVAATAVIQSQPHLGKTVTDEGTVLFAAREVGRAVAEALDVPRRSGRLPAVEGLSSMPSDLVRAVEEAVDATLREHLPEAVRDSRAEARLEVVSFLHALCFERCAHRCPASPDEPAGALWDRAEPWEIR